MVEIGVVLGLLSALFKGAKSISVKLAATATDEFVTSWIIRVASIPFLLAGILTIGQFMAPKSINFIVILLLNIFLVSIITYLKTMAFKISAISVIGPLLAFSPLFVTIPAILLLGEIPSLIGIGGILSMVIGAYILHLNSQVESVFEPLLAIKDDKGARYVFLVLIIAAVAPSIDKLGIQSSTPLTWVLLTHIGMSITLGITAYIKTDSALSKTIKNNYKLFFIVGFSNSVLWLVQANAYLYTQVAYVQALKRASILLSITAGWVIFKEENIRNRYVGALFIMIGVVGVIIGI